MAALGRQRDTIMVHAPNKIEVPTPAETESVAVDVRESEPALTEA